MDPSTTLPLTVTLAVLAAAVTHATWNAIAHGIKDQTLAFALIGVGGTTVSIPLVIVAALPRSSSWPGSPRRTRARRSPGRCGAVSPGPRSAAGPPTSCPSAGLSASVPGRLSTTGSSPW